MNSKDSEPKVEVSLRGGIGNQIFQYFAGLEIAIRKNQELILDDTLILNRKHKSSSIHSLNILAAYKSYEVHPCVTRINGYYDDFQSRSIYLNRMLSNVSHRNVMKEVGFSKEIYRYKPREKLVGYFQTWRHFDFVKKYVEPDLLKPNVSILEKFLSIETNEKNLDIAIHVRRGDYVNLQNRFGLLNKHYYEDALKAIEYNKDKDQVCIFTDARNEELEELFNLKEMNVTVIDLHYGLSDVEQLALMSKFKKIVIANSSYSWWAATLSEGQTRVAAPKNWYRSMPKPIDLIPPNWIQIENDWL
jgi:hypothetical protein